MTSRTMSPLVREALLGSLDQCWPPAGNVRSPCGCVAAGYMAVLAEMMKAGAEPGSPG